VGGKKSNGVGRGIGLTVILRVGPAFWGGGLLILYDLLTRTRGWVTFTRGGSLGKGDRKEDRRVGDEPLRPVRVQPKNASVHITGGRKIPNVSGIKGGGLPRLDRMGARDNFLPPLLGGRHHVLQGRSISIITSLRKNGRGWGRRVFDVESSGRKKASFTGSSLRRSRLERPSSHFYRGKSA